MWLLLPLLRSRSREGDSDCSSGSSLAIFTICRQSHRDQQQQSQQSQQQQQHHHPPHPPHPACFHPCDSSSSSSQCIGASRSTRF